MTPNPTSTETIVLGGGCFWCLEAVYQKIAGVEQVISGYAGGSRPHPSYEQIETGVTGHAQVVQVTFQPSVISLADILDIFWAMHDPTTKDRQQYDVGPQYRSIILATRPEQLRVAKQSAAQVQELWPAPLTTEIKLLEKFYEAESYHQNYFKNHPEQAYCQIIINPKIKKLREKFLSRLKEGV